MYGTDNNSQLTRQQIGAKMLTHKNYTLSPLCHFLLCASQNSSTVSFTTDTSDVEVFHFSKV